MLFESSLFVARYWKRAPMLRIVVPLFSGMILQYYFSLALPGWAFALILSLCGLAIFRVLPLQWRFSGAWISGVCLHLLLISIGAFLWHKSNEQHQPGFFAGEATNSSSYLLQLASPLEEKRRSWKTTAKVLALYHHGQWMAVKGHLLLYLAKGAAMPSLGYGDRIITRQKPFAIKNGGNPGSFDYAQYCASQQLYHQLYLQQGTYYLLPRSPYWQWEQTLLKIRDGCLHILKRYIGKGAEAGMAEALLIGYRLDLDPEVVQGYSNTGIVHVIAISGMHLALLYGTLLWLLKWLPAKRWADFVKVAVILLVLWGFTLLTGAAASVLRAAVMFTGITLVRLLPGRHSNTFNMLAASAAVLLWNNPPLMLDAGFQLSYLAVLSILLFYHPIYQLWEPSRRWGDWLWQMVALSLAAQLLTTPVSLFYFHQFPTYFLLANLVAVPLSTVVIYGEVILLLLSPFPWPATWMGIGLKYLIMGMNNAVKWIGTLPYALIGDIHCPLLPTVLLYGFIVGIALWRMEQWRPGALWALGCLWGCIMATGYRSVLIHAQHKLVVYNLAGYTAIDAIAGNKVQFTGNDSVWASTWAATLQLARKEMGVQAATLPGLQQYGRCISFGGKRLLIIDSALPTIAPLHQLKTNYILITNDARIQIKRLTDFYDYQLLIFAAGNHVRTIEKWKAACKAMKQPYYVIGEQGAFVKELQ
ncbi:ComEC/Rec2 family competence protein [Chitinophaga sp. 30R24]|uniref:ComEC/Rec2 family competence protein n=1 Tax=Chitinophaga sp. 30R24 TaxID=3248838 RepID=UPI003B900BF1